MATGSSERVRKMKESFMELHEQGFSIPEIGKKFNLSNDTVYRHLNEIAIENGVTRDSLLQYAYPSKIYWRAKEEEAKISFDEISKQISSIINEIESCLENLDEAIEWEELNYYATDN